LADDAVVEGALFEMTLPPLPASSTCSPDQRGVWAASVHERSDDDRNGRIEEEGHPTFLWMLAFRYHVAVSVSFRVRAWQMFDLKCWESYLCRASLQDGSSFDVGCIMESGEAFGM
jgi:hypothetical protein